jgi:enediyne biosynthesis protein E5
MKPKIAPKNIQIINHATLLLGAMLFYELARTWTQIFSCILVTCAAELVLCYLYKRKEIIIYDRLTSALISALGILLIIRSSSLWIYPVVGIVSIMSKYLFCYSEKNSNQHIFNPTNFGIVTCAVFWGDRLIFVPDQYSMLPHAVGQCIVLGVIVTTIAGRLLIPLTYLASQVIFASIFREYIGLSYVVLLGSEVGVAGLLSTFFMITDPRTTPSKRSQQLMFGLLLGTISLQFKMFSIMLPQFFALFLALPIWQISTYINVLRRQKKTYSFE